MASAVGNLIMRFSADTTRFNRGAGRMQSTLGRLQRSAMGVASAFGVMGGAATFAAAIRSGEEYNRKMRGSLAIMGDVSAAMRKDMSAAAFAVARATKYSAAQAAESYYFLASAGMDAKQSVAALPAVALFAQAGNFDMATATDLATDALSAMGMTSKDAKKNLTQLTRVTDVLTKANTLANASSQQFSEALTTKAGAALKTVGKDIEEGVAVLAAWADQGIKGAEAGTAMNIVLRDLQTKAIQNAKAFKAAGVAVFDSSGEMRNLADIVYDLESRLDGMSDAGKKAALMQLGFADKSIIFIQTLLGTSAKIREYERQLRQAGGTTKEVADKQLTAMQKGMNKLGAAVTKAGASLAEAFGPEVREMLEEIANTIPKITNAMGFVGKSFKAANANVLLPMLIKMAEASKAVNEKITGPSVETEHLGVLIQELKNRQKQFSDELYGGKKLPLNVPGESQPQHGPAMQSKGTPAGVPESPFKDDIDDIQRQFDTRGMSSMEVKLFDLENMHAPIEILERVRKIISQIKAEEFENKLLDKQRTAAAEMQGRVIMLTKSMMTPLERYNSKIRDYRNLMKAGAISEKTAIRANLAAAQEYKDSLTSKLGGKPVSSGPSTKLAGYAEQGSREAYSAIMADRAQRLQAGKKNAPEEKTAKNTGDIKKAVDTMNGIMSDLRDRQNQAEELGIPA